MNGIVRKLQQTTFSFTDEVNQLCQPFFSQHHLRYLAYLRLFRDNTTAVLTNNGLIAEDFFINDTPFPNAGPAPGSFLKAGFYLSDELPELLANRYTLHSLRRFFTVLQTQAIRFHVDHGLLIYREHIAYDELFYLSAEGCATNMYSHYLNHKEQIEQFCKDFAEQASPMIKIADTNRLLLPQFELITPEQADASSEKGEGIPLLNPFGKWIEVSPREYACLYWLAHGRSAKMIANQLRCSRRTVETHLNHVKDKLMCYSRLELLRCFEKNFYLSSGIPDLIKELSLREHTGRHLNS